MIPAEFFAPMDDVDTPYRELREKMRTMNEEDLEKVSTFIGWIENKNRISIAIFNNTAESTLTFEKK